MKKILVTVLFLLLPQIALAGSQSYTTPGTYSFTVPSYGTLTATVNGAGGGGGGRNSYGGNGTNSSFGSVTGYGGSGAASWNNSGGYPANPGGAGGSATGGTVNTSGGTGQDGAVGSAQGGNGGASPNGGAGGAGVTSPFATGSAGSAPGGGGGGGGITNGHALGGGGGGGYASKTYASGDLVTNSTITVVVGSGGGGGTGSGVGFGGSGANGSVSISWTTPSPTCSVTFDQNPIAYGGSTTLRYSASNAIAFYINNVGYVGSSGSTSVGPLSTTDYSGAAGNGVSTSTCPATLSVTPPSAPTATIAASSTSIYANQSTNLLAKFSAGSGDTLTHDNIDSPVGTGWGATTNPDASKTITFAASSPGTYTFYARAQTQYYGSWTTYAQVSVTVTASPQCTISFSQNPISQGQSATLNYSSSNATSFSINNVGPLTPNTSNSTQVGPLQSTDYTGSASAGGVTNTCTAPGSSPPGTLSVSCTPAYTCSGSTIQYTSSSCQVSNVASCTSPAFCSSGSSVCLYPAPAFTPSGNQTGHLQLIPNIVLRNNPTSVYWNVSNVSTCSVTGSNGDVWSGSSAGCSGNSCYSGSGGKTSSAIKQQTTYTLSCSGLDGSSIKETQSVTITPSFQEQ